VISVDRGEKLIEDIQKKIHYPIFHNSGRLNAKNRLEFSRILVAKVQPF
jgi:hypothetical protein